jgi:hypothetical protein
VADELDVAQQEYAKYLDERKQLIDAARESARTFDKAVLTFGSAVFGFSIAFVKDVAPNPIPDTLKWLGLAWFSFALGLLASLLSFLFSHRACMFEIKAGAEALKGSGTKGQRENKAAKNHWSMATNWCNFLCIALFFVGLLFWSVFALHNISQGGQSMGTSDSGTVKKGYVPPSPPARTPSQQQVPQTPTPPSTPPPAPKK